MGGEQWGSAGLRRGGLGPGFLGQPSCTRPRGAPAGPWLTGAGSWVTLQTLLGHSLGRRFLHQPHSAAGELLAYFPEPAGWPQSIASLSGSGSATASAFSPTYEPCFCFFLILEGLGFLCVRPVISVTAHLPSLVEEAEVALSPVPGHPSEGWREVIPRLPLSRQPCSAPGS